MFSLKKHSQTTKKQAIINKKERPQIFILGASGCGKSTLINVILQKKKAKIGIGKSITRKSTPYSAKLSNTRIALIDTKGWILGEDENDCLKIIDNY